MTPTPLRGRRFETGTSLVEVAVALVLLSVSSLSAVALLHEAARTVRATEGRERLLWALTDAADSLAVHRATATGERILPDGGRLRWSVVEGRGRVEAFPGEASEPWVAVPVVPEPRP
ncbi:MAG TPA: hypothetical protein VK858_07330 [Longimicrobiales bacterium]|nr:hypothetical protein [Longimicrobiales bacterium]